MTNEKSEDILSASLDEIIKTGYTRVSKILGMFQDFSHIDPNILKLKCEIGSQVHNAIEAHYKKEFYPTCLRAQEYYAGFKNALEGELQNYKPILLEKRFYSEELLLTGRIDGIFENEGKKTLIDYKTSAQANKKVWGLQLALYCMLMKENGIADVSQAKVLHLKRDGKFKLIDLSPTEQDFELAKRAVKLYFHFNKK